jgi:hypothetical protein
VLDTTVISVLSNSTVPALTHPMMAMAGESDIYVYGGLGGTQVTRTMFRFELKDGSKLADKMRIAQNLLVCIIDAATLVHVAANGILPPKLYGGWMAPVPDGTRLILTGGFNQDHEPQSSTVMFSISKQKWMWQVGSHKRISLLKHALHTRRCLGFFTASHGDWILVGLCHADHKG